MAYTFKCTAEYTCLTKERPSNEDIITAAAGCIDAMAFPLDAGHTVSIKLLPTEKSAFGYNYVMDITVSSPVTVPSTTTTETKEQ